MIWEDKFELGDKGPFDGYQDGDLWNGWHCPMFTKEQAEIALKSMSDISWVYDDKTDSYTVSWKDIPDAGSEDYQGFDRDGKHLYSIGAYGWTWTQVGERSPREESLILINAVEERLRTLVYIYPNVTFIRELKTLAEMLGTAQEKLKHERESNESDD